jgi:DDE superfamily endonuclease
VAASKRGLQRGLKGRPRTVILFGDETIITQTPPLRAAWGQIGKPISVPITGNHARRVLYGTLSLRGGALELYYAKEWDQDHFQAYLRQIRRRWRGWRIVLFLDRGSPHTARASRRQARELGIVIRWLPVACPELNPVDHLWRHVKNDVLANEPTPNVVASVERAATYLLELSSEERLRKAGVRSPDFWLKAVMADVK